MNESAIQSRLGSWQTKALIVGVIGLLCSLFGAFFDTRQFFISYLFAYLFWAGIAFGSLEFLMIHHLTGGRWGWPVRRFFEAAIMTLPLLALLFLPLCFGLRNLYEWMDPHLVATNPILHHRQAYMNAPAFIVRAAVFFGIWIFYTRRMNRLSYAQDKTPDVEATKTLRTMSGPGLVIYPVTATFVLTDWVLSLETDWYSTMFLVLIVIGQMLTGLVFVICLLALLRREEPYLSVVNDTTFYHLGMLLFAFIMLWTYMAFGQLLIIYSGNLPHEIGWYLHRIASSWKIIVWFLFLFHFLIPFFLLLSRDLKKKVAPLAIIALVVLFAHLVNDYWLVEPSFDKGGIVLHWLDFAAPIGIGGIWLSGFCARLRSRPLLVSHDPRQAQPHDHE
ncbi:MAG TPA: hypothetical protein VGM54_05905 [Chthoniobacter sp.]|jgi:hypothetical protein